MLMMTMQRIIFPLDAGEPLVEIVLPRVNPLDPFAQFAILCCHAHFSVLQKWLRFPRSHTVFQSMFTTVQPVGILSSPYSSGSALGL